jgi:hypothetical protein
MVLKVQIGLKYLHLKFVYKEKQNHAVKSGHFSIMCIKATAITDASVGVVAS